jgi:hypothetical protein
LSRKCPECKEGGHRPHLVGCSYGPSVEDRAEFIKEHAVEMVRELEEKIRRQAKDLSSLNHAVHCLRKERDKAWSLLKEFLEEDGIANYDSRLCWYCGEPKPDSYAALTYASDEERAGFVCQPDCLLLRVRHLLRGWKGEKVTA